MIVKMEVIEKVLNNPVLVTQADNVDYLTKHGKGWVCEIDKQIVRFSIVGLVQRNVWALFVILEFKGKGIVGALKDLMLERHFMQIKETIWLGTEPKTKAENLYKRSDWIEVGIHGETETKMEMTAESWSRGVAVGN